MSWKYGLTKSEIKKLSSLSLGLKGKISVTIHKCQNIKSSILVQGVQSSPYIRLSVGDIASSKSSCQSTVSQNGGSCPIFEETFDLTLDGLNDSLHIYIYDTTNTVKILCHSQISFIQLLRKQNEVGTNASWWPLYIGIKDRTPQGFILLSTYSSVRGYPNELTPHTLTYSHPIYNHQNEEKQSNDIHSINSNYESGPYTARTDYRPPTAVTLTSPKNTNQINVTDNTIPLSLTATLNTTQIFNDEAISPPANSYPLTSPSPPVAGYGVYVNPTLSLAPVMGLAAHPCTQITQSRPITAAALTAAALSQSLSPHQAISSSRPLLRHGPTPTPALEATEVEDKKIDSLELTACYDETHQHLLYLVARVDEGRFVCDKCHGEGFGEAFTCPLTKINIHKECIKPKGEIFDSRPNTSIRPGTSKPPSNIFFSTRHPHPLTLVPSVFNGVYNCNECGGGGSNDVWYCEACNYCMHPSCAEREKYCPRTQQLK